jgi:acyl transferase domain-containing protein
MSDFKSLVFELVASKKISTEDALSLVRARRHETNEVAQQQCPRKGLFEPIAIIGMCARFPGACNVHEFSRLLMDGRCAIAEIPRDRWDPHETSSSRWGGFLDEIDQFDPLFFNISGQEAELTDPQQRLFLEAAWSAIEHAGYSPAAFSECRCGVFVGTSAGDYLSLLRQSAVPPNGLAFTGNSSSVLSGRVS